MSEKYRIHSLAMIDQHLIQRVVERDGDLDTRAITEEIVLQVTGVVWAARAGGANTIAVPFRDGVILGHRCPLYSGDMLLKTYLPAHTKGKAFAERLERLRDNLPTVSLPCLRPPSDETCRHAANAMMKWEMLS